MANIVGKQLFRWNHQLKSYTRSLSSVAVGRKHCISDTWNEAKSQVKGFSSAAKLNVASPFVSSVKLKNSAHWLSTKVDQVSNTDDLHDFKLIFRRMRDVDFSLVQQSELVAFCSGNQAKKAKPRVAWACVFPNKPELTCAASFPTQFSSYRAAFVAIVKAIEQANVIDPSQSKPLHIFIQSKGVGTRLNWLRKAYKDLVSKNWKDENGQTVRDPDLLSDILRLSGKRQIMCTYDWTKSDWVKSVFDQALALRSSQIKDSVTQDSPVEHASPSASTVQPTA